MGDKENTSTDWGLTNGKGYILNRDRGHAAACRLNLQFYLWKDALKFNIHPSILPTLPVQASIVDVAAGSGIWLVDVSRQLPDARLDGLDYDLRQAPHANFLPPSVKMSRWNVFDDVPEDLVGKYDYVHTRLLLLVVESQDPRPVLRNLLKLLKPGGYLQWDELDTVHTAVQKADPSVQAPALEGLAEWSMAAGRHDWTVRLADFATEVGFQGAKSDFFGDGPEIARAFTEQHLLTAEEFANGLARLGKLEAAEKYYRLVEQGYEECAAGAALCVPRLVCVAQKPL
ncbi:N-methyltransferase tcpN-like protein [Cladobotryum mycophilum]|uniref:N-methyltransferase tcpN-like protein n=1 Tax=Cladobotryum mycophilum TaxID=491253 RepID=A0ABR0SQS7_9HYPO